MEGQVILNAGALVQWVGVCVAIGALAASVWAIFKATRKDALDLVHKRISDLRDSHNDHAERLARTETMLEHLPTREMVANLATKLEEVSGDVRVGNAYYEGLRGRIDGIGMAVDQLVDNELREKRHEPR